MLSLHGPKHLSWIRYRNIELHSLKMIMHTIQRPFYLLLQQSSSANFTLTHHAN